MTPSDRFPSSVTKLDLNAFDALAATNHVNINLPSQMAKGGNPVILHPQSLHNVPVSPPNRQPANRLI